MMRMAVRRGRSRPMKNAAKRLARPGTMLGFLPSAASASAATDAGSMTGAPPFERGFEAM
jgi:hypothetical protein